MEPLTFYQAEPEIKERMKRIFRHALDHMNEYIHVPDPNKDYEFTDMLLSMVTFETKEELIEYCDLRNMGVEIYKEENKDKKERYNELEKKRWRE